MRDEGLETFQVSAQEQPERRHAVGERRFLHVTIVDHNPVIEGTDEVSFIDVKIPVAMVEAGLKMIPQGKLGEIDPALIVQMVSMGAEGDLIRMNEEKKTIHVRVE